LELLHYPGVVEIVQNQAVLQLEGRVGAYDTCVAAVATSGDQFSRGEVKLRAAVRALDL